MDEKYFLMFSWKTRKNFLSEITVKNDYSYVEDMAVPDACKSLEETSEKSDNTSE